jgi:hypothetical protein
MLVLANLPQSFAELRPGVLTPHRLVSYAGFAEAHEAFPIGKILLDRIAFS